MQQFYGVFRSPNNTLYVSPAATQVLPLHIICMLEEFSVVTTGSVEVKQCEVQVGVGDHLSHPKFHNNSEIRLQKPNTRYSLSPKQQFNILSIFLKSCCSITDYQLQRSSVSASGPERTSASIPGISFTLPPICSYRQVAVTAPPRFYSNGSYYYSVAQRPMLRSKSYSNENGIRSPNRNIQNGSNVWHLYVVVFLNLKMILTLSIFLMNFWFQF